MKSFADYPWLSGYLPTATDGSSASTGWAVVLGLLLGVLALWQREWLWSNKLAGAGILGVAASLVTFVGGGGNISAKLMMFAAAGAWFMLGWLVPGEITERILAVVFAIGAFFLPGHTLVWFIAAAFCWATTIVPAAITPQDEATEGGNTLGWTIKLGMGLIGWPILILVV